jgi:hypothetical protein
MTCSDVSRRSSAAAHLTKRARLFLAAATLVVLTALAMATAPGAGAAISDAEELTRFGSEGAAAGQLELPVGIATDPVTGHVYTASGGGLHSRVDEFTPWGGFVKAFGWDVAPGGVNERQEVRVRAAAGDFRLRFGVGGPGVSETGDLAVGATAGEVQAALDALTNISAGGGSVTVEGVAGTPDGVTPAIYVVVFTGGPLKETNVATQLVAVNGTTALSGGVPSTELAVRTRADGTAGGTGLESCTTESGCQAGVTGVGAGQFHEATGIAVDASGNVYVMEPANHRVQKFDSAGRFVLMFGGEVDKTKSAEVGSTEAERNRCTAAELEGGDECGIGVTGAGNGQFNAEGGGGVALCPPGALCPGGALFVADHDRIQRFSLGGEYESQLPVGAGNLQRLAFDPVSQDLYATFGAKQGVHKLSSTTGAEIGTALEAGGPGAIATDSAGDLFAEAVVHVGKPGFDYTIGLVLEYGPEGKALSPASCCEAGLLPPPNTGNNFFGLAATATNAIGDLYAGYATSGVDSFVRLFGPAPVVFEAPPVVAPTITSQFASSVQSDGATVAAEINPHFWSDTHYFVQYGTGRCSEGGCEVQVPLAPGALLTPKVFGSPVRSAGVFLEGLKPGTVYHYRFVAESGGGGPVYGIDPDGPAGPEEASAEAGLEGTFTTFEPLAAPGCANDSFRFGPAIRLPDCRAYEMVSPLDKNGGDIEALLAVASDTTYLNQSAEDGDRFTYSAYRSFGDPKGGHFTDQYIATRDSVAGWSSEAIDPAQTTEFSDSAFENAYKSFSGDLCQSWLVVPAEPVLAPGASEGYAELYRRDGCAEAGYEALIEVKPSGAPTRFDPVLQGTSANGDDAIFVANEKLTEDAQNGVFESYYASGGELHLLCVLPTGSPSAGNCSAGTRVDTPVLTERESTVGHTISADGSRVYWTDSGAKAGGPGRVYLRENPGRSQSALSGEECIEPEQACTVRVSETVSATKPARFLDASTDGARALFQITEGAQAGNLYEFELEVGSSSEIAGKVLGVAGASDDLSRIYFVSEEDIAGTTGASAGKPNLYLREAAAEGGEARFAFIATLSKTETEMEANRPSDVSSFPVQHVARATADGRVLLFISKEGLTGYDNTDLQTGEADSEVYRYEVGTPGPVCVSCDPSGARPTGRMARSASSANTTAMAGSLSEPSYATALLPRALSRDGRRVFFNSYDALLPRDTNGKEDVYEWESAPGKEACERDGAELYVASSAGCLSLISSGESSEDSEFLDASPSGDDAFFTTSASLLPQDPGLIDVYDARVGGGFAQPARSAACEGEACQQPFVSPAEVTPSSLLFSGPGNLTPSLLLSTTKPVVKPVVKRCRKGLVRKRGGCVRKKRSAHRASAKRRNAPVLSRHATVNHHERAGR